MKKHILVVLAIMLGFTACQQSPSFKVMVNLNNADGKLFVLHHIVDKELVAIDSAVMNDAMVTFTLPESDPHEFYYLAVRGMQRMMTLVPENSDVNIVGDIQNPQNIEIIGSTAQELLNEYNAKDRELYQSMMDIYSQSLGLSPDDMSSRDSLRSIFESIQNELIQYKVDFIKEHADSFVSQHVLNDIKREYSLEELKSLFSLFADKEATASLEEVRQYITAMERVEIGSRFIDFTLYNADSVQVTLSDVVKQSELVLVDFWASWCSPCRGENPHVVSAYNKYYNLGFDVLGVSLDEDKQQWVAAVEQDGLVWNNVRDIDGSVASDYMVYYIPSNYLIDGNGTIVAKNLRGEELINKIDELLR